ncbi:MAG: phosphopantetheine-binding protein [Deltaproteobacteria bacterium]|nr:phosphopantetheine-binding protein [Deltaproteobacteria bacterium]
METTLQDIENRLIQEVALIVSGDPTSLAVDMPLQELGIGSLEFVELLVFIENTYQVRLIESNLTRNDFETIRSLSYFITKNIDYGGSVLFSSK